MRVERELEDSNSDVDAVSLCVSDVGSPRLTIGRQQ